MKEDSPLDPNEKEMKEMEAVLEQKKSDNQEFEGRVKVSSKGQIVIPIEVRKAAGITEGGQELKFRYKDGKVTFEIEEYISAEELVGFFDKPEDQGNFELDLNQARQERTDQIMKRRI